MIPQAHKDGFRVLLDLDADAVTRLAQELEAAPPAAYLLNLAKYLDNRIDEIDLEDLYEVLKVLGDLSDLFAEDDTIIDDVIDGVMHALGDDEDFVDRFADIDKERFSQQLRSLIGSESLAVTSKASEVLLDSERRLCPDNCRIISDIRPVFPRVGLERPSAAVVSHMLKLGYHDESGSVREFYVSLDEADLRTMQELLERAMLKEESLKAVIAGAGIQYLGAATDGDEDAD